MHGPIGSARLLPISISRCLPMSDTLRIARIPIAQLPRSRRFSSASAGSELERFRAKWVPVRVKKTRQKKNLRQGKGGAARRDKTLAAPCRFFEVLAGKC